MTSIDILQWFAETSLAVGELIFLVLIIRRPFARAFGARAAYVLWLAPLLRLFLPELAVLPAPIEPFVLQTVAPAASSAPVAAGDPSSQNLLALAAATALFIWIAVAIAWFSSRLETQASFLHAQLADSAPASKELIAAVRKTAARLGLKTAPRIRVSNDAFGPAIVGIFRPVLFLPARFEMTYTPEERHLTLAHELSHIARGDVAARLVALAVQAAQWPNPLVHLAARAFRADQEAACDAFVIARCDAEAAAHYASAIVKSAAGAAAPAYALSMGHPVKERLIMLKSGKKTKHRLAAGATSAFGLVAVGCAATASYGYAAENEAKKETRVVEASSSSSTVIEVDEGESLEMDGVKNAAKIEVTKKNGERTVRIYDKGGALLSEKTYAPGDEAPFGAIIIKSKDGTTKTLNLSPHAERKHRMMFFGKDGESRDILVETMEDKDLMVIGDDDDHRVMHYAGRHGHGPTFVGQCAGDGDHEPLVLEWTNSSGDESGDIMTHEILCLTGDDAKSENRAETLRKVITHMEESAKKEEARRKKMIESLRKELKELEAKQR